VSQAPAKGGQQGHGQQGRSEAESTGRVSLAARWRQYQPRAHCSPQQAR
jgi:hypothetical protein